MDSKEIARDGYAKPLAIGTYDGMEFSLKLKRLMGERNFSQSMIARKLGVSQPTVSTWTRGVVFPDLMQARELAKLFGVPLDYLADDTLDAPPRKLSELETFLVNLARAEGVELILSRAMTPSKHAPPVDEAAIRAAMGTIVDHGPATDQGPELAHRAPPPVLRGFHDLLSTLRETGMRPSEAMTLGAGQVDFEASTASVVGKGRARTVYLTPWVLGLFRELAAKWPEGPILRNRLGHPWTRHATSGRFRALRALEGSPAPEGVSAESFRHAFATDALEAGVPIATVAELMGHRSTRMVERHYSKLGQRTAHLHEALGKVRPGGVSPATGSGPASRPDDPGP